VIATNTTIARDHVHQACQHADETGGLSGAAGVRGQQPGDPPAARGELGSGYPIIGVGGVLSGPTMRGQDRRRRRPGAGLHRADLRGPALVPEVARALREG
jgi:dihydroorotate dehydrogenase